MKSLLTSTPVVATNRVLQRIHALTLSIICAAAAAAGLVPAGLHAQSTASIVGTVSDSSGAVVVGATITSRNEDTGLTRTVTSNDVGLYQIPSLPIGRYTLTTTRGGFKQALVQGIVLQVAQEARIDITLSPGATAEVVQVTGASPLIQTDSSSLGTVIGNREIVDLPLNSRHVTQLIALTPGAFTSPVVGNVNSSNGGPPLGTNQGLTNFYEAAVSGGGPSKTEYLFDGITDSEQLFGGMQFEPSEDFLNEFRVASNSFSAQYGGGSAVIIMSSKSGSNHFHGTGFEFIRDNTPGFQTDAHNRFDKLGSMIAPLHQNQFGGSLGGPVIKDRLFFYLNYDATRQNRPFTQNAAVPTSAERSGDLGPASSPTLLGSHSFVDPYTGSPFPINGSGDYQIPASEMSSVAQYFLGKNGSGGAYIIPLPNNPTGPSGIHTFTYSPAATMNVDQGNARADYNIGKSNLLFARFSISDAERVNPGSYPLNGGTTATINTKNVGVGYTHVFTPNFLNEFRFGIARLHFDNSPQGLGTNYTVNAGILGYTDTTKMFPGFTNIYVGGVYTGVNGNFYAPIVNPVHTYAVRDQMILTKGRHTVTVGFDMRRIHMSSSNAAYSRGSFNFGDGHYSGNGFVDLLMGNPWAGRRGYPRNPFGATQLGFPIFIQDDWKTAGNLTINLGLRYDLAAAPVQDFNANSYFDMTRGKWIVATGSDGQVVTSSQGIAPLAYSIFKPSIITASAAGLSNNLESMSRKTFAPRIGFAYRPFGNDRTVVRAGYGIFFDPMSGNQAVSIPLINIPFIYDSSTLGPASYSNDGKDHIANYFNTPFATSGGVNISAEDLHINPPYSQEWNLAVQRELSGNLSLQVAYVGDMGRNIDTFEPINYLRWAEVGGVETNVGRQVAGVAADPAVTGGVSTVSLGSGTNYTNAASSSYHALQATLDKRYSSGLQFMSTFTWSKLIDNGSYDDGTYAGGGSSMEDPTNINRDRGLATQDVEFRFTSNAVYALPFGRGMKFGGNIPRSLDYMLGGWRLSTIVAAQSGSPFTPSQSSAPFGGEYGNRPNRIASGKLAGPTIQRWFDASAFTVVPSNSGIYGNCGRNILRGPGEDNWDASMMKDLHFTESRFLELRADAFNVFNHPWLGQPNTNIQSPSTVGVIGNTAVSANSRELQGSVKVYF